MNYPTTLASLPPEDLRKDVYFRADFMELHARRNLLSISREDFSYGAARALISGSDRFDLETPWGYGGPIASDVRALSEGLKEWKAKIAISRLAVAEFVRLHPFINPSALAEGFDMLRFNRSTVVVDLRGGREARWQFYSDSTRNCIRKASRRLDFRRLYVDEAALFQQIYDVGLRHNEASREYYFDGEFYRELLARPWCYAWVVSNDREPLAVGCFLHSDAALCHYHLAGGSEAARQMHAHYLLLEVAFEHFAAMGVRFMCLGGGRTIRTDDALLKFKAKFSPLRMPFFVGGMIHDQDAYRELRGGRSKFLCEGLRPDESADADAYAVARTSDVSPHSIVLDKENVAQFRSARRNLYVIGSGGHASVLLATLEALGVDCAGCISPEPLARQWAHVAWLGGDAAMDALEPGDVYLLNGIGSVASLELRRLVFERAKAAGFSFISIVHPSALVEKGVTMGEGAQVMAGAILQTGVALGVNCIINTGAIVDHDCRIGAHSHLASGVRLSGGVRTGENVHIGTGASVIQGVALQSNVIVGAGSVVLGDVPMWTRVAGTPARHLKRQSRCSTHDPNDDLKEKSV